MLQKNAFEVYHQGVAKDRVVDTWDRRLRQLIAEAKEGG